MTNVNANVKTIFLIGGGSGRNEVEKEGHENVNICTMKYEKAVNKL